MPAKKTARSKKPASKTAPARSNKKSRSNRHDADANRVITLIDTPARAVKIAISQNYPSAPATVSFTIPIVHDDLDLAHTQLAAHLHITVRKR